MATPQHPEKLLFVDDDLSLLEAMRRQFRREFNIQIALGAEEGLKALREQGPFAVVVSDQSMPGMKGEEFLARVREISPDTPRIMLSGFTDWSSENEVVNQGVVFRFLSKPVPREQMREALILGIEHFRLVTSQREQFTLTDPDSESPLTLAQ